MMRHALTSAALFATAWLLWSGHYIPLTLVCGVISCGLVLWVALHMEVIDQEGVLSGIGLRHLTYFPWLALEIAKSSLHVAAVILNPRLPIQPRLVRVRASQRTATCAAIHANSITLTPGTISLDVRERSILVHALTEKSAEGLLGGEIDRRVTRLEGLS
jgi:multicomponent Na+:H+ antiporter subunit E